MTDQIAQLEKEIEEIKSQKEDMTKQIEVLKEQNEAKERE